MRTIRALDWFRRRGEVKFLVRVVLQRCAAHPSLIEMTAPQGTDTDLERGRRQATLGIGLVVAAAVGLSAFESIVSRRFVFTGLARAALILLVGILAYRGRRWAAWVFGFFALAGAAAGVIGLAGTSFSAVGLMLFGPVVAASATGFAQLYFAAPARAFLRRQQSMAPRSMLPPPPPNG